MPCRCSNKMYVFPLGNESWTRRDVLCSVNSERSCVVFIRGRGEIPYVLFYMAWSAAAVMVVMLRCRPPWKHMACALWAERNGKIKIIITFVECMVFFFVVVISDIFSGQLCAQMSFVYFFVPDKVCIFVASRDAEREREKKSQTPYNYNDFLIFFFVCLYRTIVALVGTGIVKCSPHRFSLLLFIFLF